MQQDNLFLPPLHDFPLSLSIAVHVCLTVGQTTVSDIIQREARVYSVAPRHLALFCSRCGMVWCRHTIIAPAAIAASAEWFCDPFRDCPDCGLGNPLDGSADFRNLDKIPSSLLRFTAKRFLRYTATSWRFPQL